MLGVGAVVEPPRLVREPTRSWWLDNLPSSAVPTPLATLPATADVVVIGAGMTGCATAHWLQRLFGRSCLVLDARGVAGGATGRNGGHLWSNPRSDFERDTVNELLEFLEGEGIDCDLTRDGAAALERCAPETGVVYHDVADDLETIDDADWGETPVWDKSECAARLQTEAFSAATHYKGAAQFFPAKVAAALLQASGASLCVPVRVQSIDAAETEAGVSDQLRHAVATDRGVVRARVVVVATNGWATDLLPELEGSLFPCRNQVIMTRPVPAAAAWEVGAVSCDSDVGARELYMIRRPDGRLCLGGARALEEEAAVGSRDDGSLHPTVGAYLRRFLRERFPRLGAVEVEAEWTGVLGFTKDGTPLIGQVRPGVFAAVGFCGHGMPQCTGAGKAIAQMIGSDDGSSAAEEVHPFVRGPANVARVLSPDS